MNTPMDTAWLFLVVIPVLFLGLMAAVTVFGLAMAFRESFPNKRSRK